MKKYEIREARTNELLADELTEEKALELFMAYQNFYGVGSVYITSYIVPHHTMSISRTLENKRAQDYKNDFILLYAELQEMGNLL